MPKRGTVREDGKIFLKIRKGEEVWVAKDVWENHISWRKKYNDIKRTEHRNKTKKWKIGDPNLENGLYFIRYSGNYTPIWGTEKRLTEYRNQRYAIKLAYREKMKDVKNINKQTKRKRGDWDPILNLYFFKYNSLNGSEIWYTKEVFNKYRDQDKIRRTKSRTKTQA